MCEFSVLATDCNIYKVGIFIEENMHKHTT